MFKVRKRPRRRSWIHERACASMECWPSTCMERMYAYPLSTVRVAGRADLPSPTWLPPMVPLPYLMDVARVGGGSSSGRGDCHIRTPGVDDGSNLVFKSVGWAWIQINLFVCNERVPSQKHIYATMEPNPCPCRRMMHVPSASGTMASPRKTLGLQGLGGLKAGPDERKRKERERE